MRFRVSEFDVMLFTPLRQVSLERTPVVTLQERNLHPFLHELFQPSDCVFQGLTFAGITVKLFGKNVTRIQGTIESVESVAAHVYIIHLYAPKIFCHHWSHNTAFHHRRYAQLPYLLSSHTVKNSASARRIIGILILEQIVCLVPSHSTFIEQSFQFFFRFLGEPDKYVLILL